MGAWGFTVLRGFALQGFRVWGFGEGFGGGDFSGSGDYVQSLWLETLDPKTPNLSTKP